MTFMQSFFGAAPQLVVTEYEFQKRVIPDLIALYKFTDGELNDVRKITYGAREEDDKGLKVITAKELSGIIEWLKKNKNKHSLNSDERIEQFHSVMHKYLIDS